MLEPTVESESDPKTGTKPLGIPRLRYSSSAV